MPNPESKKLAIDVIARVDKLEKNMAKARRATNDNFKKMESRADRFKGKMAGIGKSAFAPFAAGALAALAPLAAFNRSLATISDASELAKAADRVGLATTAFQELAFGFELAGVAAATFETGMQQFTRRIAEAEVKGGTLAKILEANGVAIRDTSGKMRTAESILADYADLMKNAASEQERMLLATEAFGRGGADFTLALKNGSDGLRDMQKATADAGGTIDEELLRRAEKLDDQFATLWRRFDVNAKTAILSAASYLSQLENKLGEIGNSSFFKSLADKLGAGDAVYVPGEGVYRPGKDELSPSARVAQAIQGGLEQADAELVAALQKRYGDASKEATKTVLPTTGGGGSKSISADLDLAKRVLENLEHERDLIGATNVDRAKANALRTAGATATAGQRAEISALVDAIYAERDAFESAAEAAEEMRDIGKDAISGIISDVRSGTSALDAFGNALGRIADRLLDLSLDSLFSGGGSGFGKIFGFAGGGIAAHGRPQPLPTFAGGGVCGTITIKAAEELT